MTESATPPLPRDEKIIAAAMAAATGAIAKNILTSMADRGGTPDDAVQLLGRINAVVLAQITDGQPEAKATTEDLIDLLAAYSREATRKLRADRLLRNLPSRRGLRP